MSPIDHPPISDPNHPDHGDWQHEFVDAPTPDEVAALTEEAQKRVDDDEVARVVAAEVAAERDGTAPVEPVYVHIEDGQPVEPVEPAVDENGNPIEPPAVPEGTPPENDPNAAPPVEPVEPAQ